MENNKTIIILLSIVLTVIVFVVVCLWLFYPRNVATATPQPTPIQFVQGLGGTNLSDAAGSAVASPGVGSGGVDNASPSTDGQPIASIVNQNVLVVDGNATGTGQDYIMGKDGRLIRNPGSGGQPATGSQVPGASAAPVEPAATTGVEVKPDTGIVISTGNQKPAASAKPTPSPKPAASVKPTAKPAPAAKTDTAGRKSGKDFWIQVISSTNKDRVEQVRKDLAALGFNGRVLAFNKDGVDFYRLRYGPYAKKDEARKFLDWVKMIKGMEGSFVVEEAFGAKPAATVTTSAKP